MTTPVNALPLNAFPGFTWQSVVSDQVQEIVTTINTQSLEALSQVPDRMVAWADIGTRVSQGMGIVKIPIRLPQSMTYNPFTYSGGQRNYNTFDIAAPVVKVNPWDLNYAWPMVWDAMGKMNLMSQMSDGTLEKFMGVSGLAATIVSAAKFHKSQLVASLFWKGMTYSSIGLTAQALTVPQPGNPNGLPLFTNGSDSAQHYAHPFRADSGRFKNVYTAYGSFDTTFEDSLVEMTQRPHPILPNMTMGLQVTDVLGPTWMRKRFYQKAVQMLQLQTSTIGGNGVAAATSNVFTNEMLKRYNEDTFIGASGFGPIRYWIVPALDSHPYFTASSNANMTTGPGGGPADMWIEVADSDPQLRWAEMAAPTKEFTPLMRLYGDGDPLSMSQRRVRLETDLDAGIAAGLPHTINVFFGV